MDDFDLSKLIDKPTLKIERQRSFDERSLSEVYVGLSRGLEHYENVYSPERSGFDTSASSTRNSFEPHHVVVEAWESLWHSMVHFRGQPIDTLAAVDHGSVEVLNYDQFTIENQELVQALSMELSHNIKTKGSQTRFQNKLWYVPLNPGERKYHIIHVNINGNFLYIVDTFNIKPCVQQVGTMLMYHGDESLIEIARNCHLLEKLDLF